MRKLEITCALLPFHMVVSASKLFGQDYVTVGDVLAELYSQLRTQISQDEYHRVGGGSPDELDVPADAFTRHLDLLADHEVIPIDVALDRLAAGDDRPCVVLTFDDGFSSEYRPAR